MPPTPGQLSGGRVTMKDVAAALGVSTATVSRALAGDPAISDATRHAVTEMAQRVQYRPSAAARRLRTKSTSLIGVVVQSVGDGYVGEVVLGIQGRARDLGYQPLFFAAEARAELEMQALDVFLSEQVSELIAVSPTGRPGLLRRAVAEGMRVAVINGDAAVPAAVVREVAQGTAAIPPLGRFRGALQTSSDALCHITFDDVGAGRAATEHLAGLGHRSFVHLQGPPVRSGLLRLVGYRQALTEAGLWPQPVLVPAAQDLAAREEAVAGFLATARPPVAMVAYDDLAAVAALHAAHRAGWRVPEDLSVVGIDDIQLAAYTNPGLTTMAQPKHELGALAVDAVLAGRRGGDCTGCDRARQLGGQLVIRESTARVPSPDRQEDER
ncbi:MAG TPA: LacI family DNA-binding transcriptional regulator [Streptosporangiaceae bacterium]